MLFRAEEALEIAQSLSFPRLVGSPGEEKAASFIEKKLRESGYFPQREEFLIPLAPWTMMKGFVSSALILSIMARGLSFLSPILSGSLMLLIFVSLAFYPSFWLRFAGSNFFGRRAISPEKKGGLPVSQNIVANLPAPSKAEQYLYLIAHYDSKDQSLPLLRRVFFLLLAGCASLWLSFFYLGAPRKAFASFPSWEADFPLALALGGMLILFLMKTGNRSPGGLDNA